MKRAIVTVGPVFSTSRMVAEYMERAYAPAVRRHEALSVGNLERAQSLAHWRHGMHQGWKQIRILSVQAQGAEPLHVGNRAVERLAQGVRGARQSAGPYLQAGHPEFAAEIRR